MFHEIIKGQRKDLNLSHEQVSYMVGIDRSYYTKIENGLKPSVKVAQAIGNVLGIDWTIFFAEKSAENAHIKHSNTKWVIMKQLQKFNWTGKYTLCCSENGRWSKSIWRWAIRKVKR